MKISPNPAGEVAEFELEDLPVGERHFLLSNTLGQVVARQDFHGRRLFFERDGLPPGAYFFSLSVEDSRQLSGKLILR